MHRRSVPLWLVALATVAGVVAGAVIALVVADDGGGVGGRSPSAAGIPAPTEARPGPDVASAAEVMAVVEAIGPLLPPTECPFQDEPNLLPNAPRDYRGGVHQGIDFGCAEAGADVVAPLAGRVLVATHGYEEPAPEDRQALLDFAREQGDTPPWTLIALYGRFVVIDHGIIEGAGHVVTIYAHLAAIDPALRPAMPIAAGDRIGAVGHSGTSAGAADEDRGYELHWEIHVDGTFLGRGLTPEESSVPYRALFGG